jgi:hypothetical protein
MESFEYGPIDLEGPSFRLLRLFRGTESDIECELFQAWLDGDSAVSYEALSYTWGGTEKSASILIDGKRLDVTENLYLALQYLRLEETDRILWIDAISIDQGNLKERGHQVQQMGNIYSHAHQVIFWLGPATHEINVLMSSLRRLEEESIKHVCKDWSLADKRWRNLWLSMQPMLKNQHWDLVNQQRIGLELLLGRLWFKRVWILQEVANAKRAVVSSGTKSVSARIFALAPFLMEINPEPHCQAVLDIMPGRSRKDSWWSQRRDLYTLLVKFGGSMASDPRDMLFALLGISSDARDTDSLRADYTKDHRQVVHDTSLFIFGLSGLPFHTIPELVCNCTSLNTMLLSRVARFYDASGIAEFLMRRGDAVNVTEEVVKAVVENEKSAKEVMELLLQLRGNEVDITEKIVRAAGENEKSGKGVIDFLLQQRGKALKATEGFVTELARSFGAKSMGILLQQQGSAVKVTKEVVKAAAGNEKSGKEVLDLLLQQRGNEVKVTEEVVKAAAGNEKSGKEVLGLLLQRRGNEVKVTKAVIKAAAGNEKTGNDVMDFLLQQRGNDVKVTKAVVEAVIRNEKNGKEMMEFLLQHRHVFLVTQRIVRVAAMNAKSGEEVIELLLQQRGKAVNVTEGLVVELTRSFGAKPMGILLQQQGSAVKVTEKVVKAAVQSGVAMIALLFEQRGSEVMVTKEVVKAAKGNWVDGKEVMEFLRQHRSSEVKAIEDLGV